MVSAFDELESHLKQFATAPFLFVGSGVSKRYLQLEAWSDLLERFAEMTTKPYAYYLTSANGDLPRVASALANEFHEAWWSDARFAASRQALADGSLTSREGPLKAEIARHVDAALANLPTDGELAEEIALLGEAVIDGVITTNYDRLLEQVFDDYKVYTGQDQLLFSDPQGVGEIYKIHGGADRPESLVLTESDYALYRERNPYLAAKLLTIFVEHPVIFIGYTLSDQNVREILVSVAQCLTADNLSRLQDRLIFVKWNPDVDRASFSRSFMTFEGLPVPVITIETASFGGIFRALGSIQRKFPARLLRQLKEHVYELVRTNHPGGRLYVHDIDADSDLSQVDVVFGVGMQQRLSSVGYVGITRHDVLDDVLLDRSQWDPAPMVYEALPGIIHRSPTSFIPIFRYLRGTGLLLPDGALRDDVDLDERLRARAEEGVSRIRPAVGTAQEQRLSRIRREAGGSLADLRAACSPADLAAAICLVPADELDLTQLLGLINDTRPQQPDTAWAKLVCLYDYLKFARVDEKPGEGS